MKRLTVPLTLFLGMIAIACSSAAQSSANAQFDKLASLAGTWQGKTKNGEPVTSTYELVSNGSAVMERLAVGSDPAMITIYHRDGEQLMLTHYCSAGNQPRMRAELGKEDSNVIRFSFIDATNLADPADGHMRKVAFTFHDENHISQEWTWRENYQEKSSKFELTREK